MRDVPFPRNALPPQIILNVAINRRRPSIPDYCPPGVRALITACWRDDPRQRPPARALMARLEELQVRFEYNKGRQEGEIKNNRGAVNQKSEKGEPEGSNYVLLLSICKKRRTF